MFDSALFLPETSRPSFRGPRPFRAFHDVRWDSNAPAASWAAPRSSGARLVGLRYETRVLDVLEAIYGAAFRRSPRIQYQDTRGAYRPPLTAIPDGVLTLPEWTVIVEVKLAHTIVVWEQLMERYLPLVSALTPAPLRPVEICRSYDPAIPLPGRHSLIDSLHRPPGCVGELEVLQWRI